MYRLKVCNLASLQMQVLSSCFDSWSIINSNGIPGILLLMAFYILKRKLKKKKYFKRIKSAANNGNYTSSYSAYTKQSMQAAVPFAQKKLGHWLQDFAHLNACDIQSQHAKENENASARSCDELCEEFGREACLQSSDCFAKALAMQTAETSSTHNISESLSKHFLSF